MIERELVRQGINQAELARRAGISRAVVNKLINETTPNPSADTLVAVARGLGVSPERMLREAGILPPQPDMSAVTDMLLNIASQLGEVDQQELLEIAEVKLRRKRSYSALERVAAKLRSLPPDAAEERLQVIDDFIRGLK
ncbi:MAG TPA: helix-turn-helix domain-containing protein [Bellilinea sp.]|nr:helix-turn-helix domain-containing protein [Bellilinea sp.]